MHGLEISFLYSRIQSRQEKDKTAFFKAKQKDLTSWMMGWEDHSDASEL